LSAKKLSYSITGQGLLNTFLYPNAESLYDFLNKYNYGFKFHNTKQLGSLQYLFKGAHHTRYEYIFLQWTLIHYTKETSNNLGLNTEFSFANKRVTPADLLQCLAILVNMGHFPDTFAASKTWLHLLKENYRGLRSQFKQGLEKKDKQILDRIIQSFDFHNIHIVNALFLLERYRRSSNGNSMVEFSKQILIEYYEGEENSTYWSIYRVIRKIAYILMDSNYAPIPFKIDLSTILLNLDHYEDELTTEDSIFYKTLNQVNNMLEDSLYLFAESILTSTLRSYDLFNQIMQSNSRAFNKTSNIRRLLEPFSRNKEQLSLIFRQERDYPDLSSVWDFNNMLDIKYFKTDYPIEYFNEIFPNDIFKFEKDINSKLGINMCVFSASIPPNRNNFRLAIALRKDIDQSKKITKSLEVLKTVIDIDNDFKNRGLKRTNIAENEFKSSLLTFLFKYIFGYQTRYWFEHRYLNKSEMPLFIARGTVKVAQLIRKYIKELDDDIGNDILHELKLTLAKVEELDYRGLIIVFLGSTKILKSKSKKSNCEFDGIILLPMKKKSTFLYVIEAKNKPLGSTEAKTQLNKRLEEFLLESLTFSVEQFGHKGAIASVSVI